MPKKYLERFHRIDSLISKKATGTPEEFAQKMNISVSMLYEYLAILRDLGAPICYDKERRTYFYSMNGQFKIKFELFITPIILEFGTVILQ